MIVLAADTTTAVNTVAVCEQDRVLAETVVACGRSHSERLLDTVAWVLREAGVALGNVDALAISIGPGSFTGLRVGAATWKGLALAHGLPLVPVPTLDAMARLSAHQDGYVCPMLDARMGEVFGAVYRFCAGARDKLAGDFVGPVETLLEGLPGHTLFLGDGATRYCERIRARVPDAAFAADLCAVPRASAVAAEGLALIARGVCTDAGVVAPIYLRKSQAEENRSPGLPSEAPRI